MAPPTPILYATGGSASLLWHYLGSFTLYTLLAIAFIYAAFFYLKKKPHLLRFLPARQAASPWDKLKPGLGFMTFGKKFVQSKDQPPCMELALESTLPLEPRKTLYVVRCGNERFLIAASDQQTTCLAKLQEGEGAIPNLQAPAGEVEKPEPPAQDSTLHTALDIPEPTSLQERIQERFQRHFQALSAQIYSRPAHPEMYSEVS